MTLTDDYKIGLLSLMHLLIRSDHEISTLELNFFEQIRREEKIDDTLFDAFRKSLNHKTEKEIYKEGLALIEKCHPSLKTRAFRLLTAMALADSNIDAQETNFLMQSSQHFGFN
jgi:uncharacterized tellurite resistance protein B-like protein